MWKGRCGNMRADKDKITKLLKTARGQLDGILKMVADDRYCMDISQQLMAVEAILNKANKEILTAHLKGCVVAVCSVSVPPMPKRKKR